MKFLIKGTTLNKNLCGIISNYVNYTRNNLISILKTNNFMNTKIRLKNNITIIDIIVLCGKVGGWGFYIENTNTNNY
jgi:hypothetical protein